MTGQYIDTEHIAFQTNKGQLSKNNKNSLWIRKNHSTFANRCSLFKRTIKRTGFLGWGNCVLTRPSGGGLWRSLLWRVLCHFDREKRVEKSVTSKRLSLSGLRKAPAANGEQEEFVSDWGRGDYRSRDTRAATRARARTLPCVWKEKQ